MKKNGQHRLDEHAKHQQGWRRAPQRCLQGGERRHCGHQPRPVQGFHPESRPPSRHSRGCLIARQCQPPTHSTVRPTSKPTKARDAREPPHPIWRGILSLIWRIQGGEARTSSRMTRHPRLSLLSVWTAIRTRLSFGDESQNTHLPHNDQSEQSLQPARRTASPTHS